MGLHSEELGPRAGRPAHWCIQCCCLMLAGGVLVGRDAPSTFLSARGGRRLAAPRHHLACGLQLWRLQANREMQRMAPGKAAPADQQPHGNNQARAPRTWSGRWRARAAAAMALVGALLTPQTAWARTLRRVASRDQERTAFYATIGFLAVLFIGAYFNSKKEDSSEDTRIKSEVERLVRLKKEFEDAESIEEADDDSMMASLRAAQQKMAAEREKEAATAEGSEDNEEGEGGGSSDTTSEGGEDSKNGGKDGPKDKPKEG